MTVYNYDEMDLDELRRYILKHRDDMEAFYKYVDRSRECGRMIVINAEDPSASQKLDAALTLYAQNHHPQEQNYWNEMVEVESSTGDKKSLQTYLLRVYPETFNRYDAYMDIPISSNPDIAKVYSSRLDKKWNVISGPTKSPIKGYFRGDNTINNPPAWVFGLKWTDN